jgi:hypothetical protein
MLAAISVWGSPRGTPSYNTGGSLRPVHTAGSSHYFKVRGNHRSVVSKKSFI